MNKCQQSQRWVGVKQQLNRRDHSYIYAMSTTILTHAEYECTVCHIALDRIMISYGGLSCLSCRAFFRRMCQKENIAAECKEKMDCRVSIIESCPPCRFQKCLR